MDKSKILYIHGSDSTGNAYKAQVIRRIFPNLISPNFSGLLSERISLLDTIIIGNDWTIIGSSLGGLLAAIYTAKHSEQVRKLILLAPALHLSEYTNHLPKPVNTSTTLIIGKKDDVIPVDYVCKIARRVFRKLKYYSVDDDHSLHHTAETLNWEEIIS